ncbi:GAF domain-containing sensor histidine kinase [Arthrobacter sp. AL08]|uniref:GAF domain-containing sensor histidine kinase n=1 Tax=Micrococcaceae TaxID=1268 RepID=UPI0020970CE9|nr:MULTISPECIES: GAF domain-containing sensor histidine kinase [Micrococcaceae]MDD1477600.1 GAF domain-containing sensor histidine kinase [Arthrobacter sp. H16F315]MDI3241804.1 GAF domain-containing sensor histidine kinase [Arthrobacter sp. AL05]MDI3277872.1 GAF domain-containing sensor histidine kinase [Arthrobacter sp. AL08]MDJ0351754.1 GAF domain-containing sensor histidine kinase [Pseudarthrobacter sp. PH31-O2]
MHSAGNRPDQTTAEPEPMIDDTFKGFVSRAEELLQSQERMAGLLEAVVAIAEDLSLDAVLERVVQSACRLLRARFGALGVIGDDRALSHFITVGIDEELAHRIGPLPTGHGVLGLLISDPRPLRLHDLRSHPESYGFPADHPPMNSFLGVPVRVRDVVFGNLYLTEKEDGSDFTAEDEGLAVALAAAAGVAIENARLYDDARRRARWLEACMDVSGLMLSNDRDYTFGGLDPIASRALQESGSQLAMLVAPAAGGRGYLVAGVAGAKSAQFSGRSLTLDLPLLESVLDGGEPVVLDDASALFGGIDGGITGPLLAVALSTQGAHHGLLILVRDTDSLQYARTDIEMGAVFGSHVALALELARVHRLREELLVFTDRERIARDLHDLVIQRLFAAGLSVQSLTRFTKDELATDRIRTITGELDEAIRSLRDTIYSLKSSSSETELLSGRIRRVARSSAKSMPFAPSLTITGPVDAVTPDKADNVVAVVSEGLSNALRHSGADAISVSVGVVKGRVTVVITDNGAGFTEPGKRRGLANLEDRARMLDGSCTITSAPDAGTSLEWSVPL